MHTQSGIEEPDLERDRIARCATNACPSRRYQVRIYPCRTPAHDRRVIDANGQPVTGAFRYGSQRHAVASADVQHTLAVSGLDKLNDAPVQGQRFVAHHRGNDVPQRPRRMATLACNEGRPPHVARALSRDSAATASQDSVAPSRATIDSDSNDLNEVLMTDSPLRADC
jgi:hypothetical protein